MKFPPEDIHSSLPGEVLLLFLQWNTISAILATPKLLPPLTNITTTTISTTTTSQEQQQQQGDGQYDDLLLELNQIDVISNLFLYL